MKIRPIILGTKDYLHDCYHDWLCKRARAIDCRIFERVISAPRKLGWQLSFEWKEGSLWHYIRQRRIGLQRAAFAKKYGIDLEEALFELEKEDISKFRLGDIG